MGRIDGGNRWVKKSNTSEVLYLVIAVLVIIEFNFIQGLFTWLIAVGAITFIGIVNIVLQIIEKNLMKASLYTICTLALCMGYFQFL